MIKQEEITRSTDDLKKFYTSSMIRLPAIMKLIKLMQDGLHKPMLDHQHKNVFRTDQREFRRSGNQHNDAN